MNKKEIAKQLFAIGKDVYTQYKKSKAEGGSEDVGSTEKGGGIMSVIGGLIGGAVKDVPKDATEDDERTGQEKVFDVNGEDNYLGDVGIFVLDNVESGNLSGKDPYVPIDSSNRSAQHFNEIRDECLKSRHLFEDEYFPAIDSSVFYSQRPSKSIEWLRPHQIVPTPKLFVKGDSTFFDIVTGELGTRWLLAPIAALILRVELFYRVVPPDQSFTDEYAGVFHFQLWHYGKWVDVVVDDRVPCSDGKLLCIHSVSNNAFWCALLEKAYAKLYGSYEALKYGTSSEGLTDFTGGLTEVVELKHAPASLMQTLYKATEYGSLLGCITDANSNDLDTVLPSGLVKGQAYSITGLQIVDSVVLLRIRNPWFWINRVEWNGPWSDGSREWDSVASEQRDEMGIFSAYDGEFWMSLEDLGRNFDRLEICHLGPDVTSDVADMTGRTFTCEQWKMKWLEGSWIRGQSAGGCPKFLETFPNNPQFLITLVPDGSWLTTCIISVMQKFQGDKRKDGVDMVPIGFVVYDVTGANNGRLDSNFVSGNTHAAKSDSFIKVRENVGRFDLRPGHYVMIPCTLDPDTETDFTVRVFAYTGLRMQQL